MFILCYCRLGLEETKTVFIKKYLPNEIIGFIKIQCHITFFLEISERTTREVWSLSFYFNELDVLHFKSCLLF